MAKFYAAQVMNLDISAVPEPMHTVLRVLQLKGALAAPALFNVSFGRLLLVSGLMAVLGGYDVGVGERGKVCPSRNDRRDGRHGGGLMLHLFQDWASLQCHGVGNQD
jgi:hypothetical protein